MQVRGTHHIGLVTGQFERLRLFYVELLGLSEVGGFPKHQIVFLDAGTTLIELLGEERPVDAPPAGASARFGWHHLALEVDNVDAAFGALVARGAAVHSPPEDFPPASPAFRIAFLRDPDGNLVELIQKIGGQ